MFFLRKSYTITLDAQGGRGIDPGAGLPRQCPQANADTRQVFARHCVFAHADTRQVIAYHCVLAPAHTCPPSACHCEERSDVAIRFSLQWDRTRSNTLGKYEKHYEFAMAARSCTRRHPASFCMSLRPCTRAHLPTFCMSLRGAKRRGNPYSLR